MRESLVFFIRRNPLTSKHASSLTGCPRGWRTCQSMPTFSPPSMDPETGLFLTSRSSPDSTSSGSGGRLKRWNCFLLSLPAEKISTPCKGGQKPRWGCQWGENTWGREPGDLQFVLFSIWGEKLGFVHSQILAFFQLYEETIFTGRRRLSLPDQEVCNQFFLLIASCQ